MKTIRTGTVGPIELRLVQTDKDFVAVAFQDAREVQRFSSSIADDAWRMLQHSLSKEGPNWFGYTGAKLRFLHWFENGFQSENYLEQERSYKLKAKAELEATTPLSVALAGEGHGEAVLRAYRATNLLYPIEKTRMQTLLRGPDADNFVQAAAGFASGEGKSALKAMEKLLRPHENAKWTVVSYLSFLWQPDRHIFLKPEVTKDFAARVGHAFARSYSADLDFAIYEDLLDMAEEIRSNFSDLEPRDMIDVQSVIWVTESYQDGREAPAS